MVFGYLTPSNLFCSECFHQFYTLQHPYTKVLAEIVNSVIFEKAAGSLKLTPANYWSHTINIVNIVNMLVPARNTFLQADQTRLEHSEKCITGKYRYMIFFLESHIRQECGLELRAPNWIYTCTVRIRNFWSIQIHYSPICPYFWQKKVVQ
jgi:hypothetical protein